MHECNACWQLVRVTGTSATWGCVYLSLPGVMVTLIVQTAVMSYLGVTAVSYFCSLCSNVQCFVVIRAYKLFKVTCFSVFLSVYRYLLAVALHCIIVCEQPLILIQMHMKHAHRACKT